jgi:surface protein
MFYYALAFNSDITSWNTSSVTNMNYMFSNASSFNQNINYNSITGSWNTSSVIDMSYMFQNATLFNKPIVDWNVSSVVDMRYMFNSATQFKQDLSNWNPKACYDMTDMFTGCDINNPDSTTNQDNYNALLISWGIDKLADMQPNVIFNGGNSQYSSISNAVTGRDNLTTQKGWTITDGGVV